MSTRGWRCFAVSSLVAALAGCVGNTGSTEDGAPLARQVAQSDHCGLTTPGLVLVTSTADVNDLQSMPARHLSLEPLRETDFEREHLVLISLGQQPTSGYSITLDSSEIRDQQLELTVKTAQPDEGMMTAQVLTTPCTVVAVTREGWKALQVSGEGFPAVSRERSDQH